MRIDILTLFPEMCETVMAESIIGRARKRGAVQVCCHQIRDFAYDKHNRVDDTLFGGGMGMLMMAEPIALCMDDLVEQLGKKPHVLYMSPQGSVLSQEKVKELATYENIAILCGHYEGVDERVLEAYVDEEISIGDYVLTGGELPALVVADAVCRMKDGVLSNDITTACWNIRSTPARQRGAGGASLRCFCRGTTQRSQNGAGSNHFCAHCTNGQTCSPRRS